MASGVCTGHAAAIFDAIATYASVTTARRRLGVFVIANAFQKQQEAERKFRSQNCATKLGAVPAWNCARFVGSPNGLRGLKKREARAAYGAGVKVPERVGCSCLNCIIGMSHTPPHPFSSTLALQAYERAENVLIFQYTTTRRQVERTCGRKPPCR